MKMKRSIVSLLLAFVLMFTIQAPTAQAATYKSTTNTLSYSCTSTKIRINWGEPVPVVTSQVSSCIITIPVTPRRSLEASLIPVQELL